RPLSWRPAVLAYEWHQAGERPHNRAEQRIRPVRIAPVRPSPRGPASERPPDRGPGRRYSGEIQVPSGPQATAGEATPQPRRGGSVAWWPCDEYFLAQKRRLIEHSLTPQMSF